MGCGLHRRLPQVVEVVERQLSVEVKEVVGHVDDEALVFSAVGRAAESTPDDLLVEVRAEHRSGDHDGACTGSVETFG